ncbi:putative beta-amylase [Helianthus anomalus]
MMRLDARIMKLCYDEYLRKCLKKAAEAIGISKWGSPPDGAGSYNDEPEDTDFFCKCGDYNRPYGRFFSELVLPVSH